MGRKINVTPLIVNVLRLFLSFLFFFSFAFARIWNVWIVFKRHLLAVAIEQIHVIVIAFGYETNQFHRANQINRAGKYPVFNEERLIRNYISFLGQTGQKPHPVQRHIHEYQAI